MNDDLAARKIAIARGLNVIGIIGVLASAAKSGLIDVDQVIS